jgi:hypothetical protein
VNPLLLIVFQKTVDLLGLALAGKNVTNDMLQPLINELDRITQIIDLNDANWKKEIASKI